MLYWNLNYFAILCGLHINITHNVTHFQGEISLLILKRLSGLCNDNVINSVAGFIADATQSYDVAFYVSGASIAVAGIICFPLRRLARWRAERHKSKSVESECPQKQEHDGDIVINVK